MSSSSYNKRLRRILRVHKIEVQPTSSAKVVVSKPTNQNIIESDGNNDDERRNETNNQRIMAIDSALVALPSNILDIIQQRKRQRRLQLDQQVQQYVVVKDNVAEQMNNEDSREIAPEAARESLSAKFDPYKQQEKNNSNNSNEQYTDSSHVLNSDLTTTATTTTTRGEVMIQKIQDLRNVYIYGLITVSKLQDLRNAPDAILPGNFCSPTTTATNTTTTTADKS